MLAWSVHSFSKDATVYYFCSGKERLTVEAKHALNYIYTLY